LLAKFAISNFGRTYRVFGRIKNRKKRLNTDRYLLIDVIRGIKISCDMKIFVKAKPKAKEEKIEKIDETHFVVSVKEPPIKGQANMAIIKALAGYFSVPASSVSIVSGFSSKQKIIEISLAN